MSNQLERLCERRLTAARGFYFGDVYRKLGLRSRRYEGFQLVWDAPTHMTIIAFCWDVPALQRLREDVLHLHATLPQLQIYKKLHLVMFYADDENAAEQPWPAGVSFSPIALNPNVHVDNPPEFVRAKLDSILGIPAGAVASMEIAAMAEQAPDWRLFLQNDRDIVMQKIKELSKAKTELPTDLQSLVDDLLRSAEADAPDLSEQVHQVLNRLWEVPSDATAGASS